MESARIKLGTEPSLFLAEIRIAETLVVKRNLL